MDNDYIDLNSKYIFTLDKIEACCYVNDRYNLEPNQIVEFQSNFLNATNHSLLDMVGNVRPLTLTEIQSKYDIICCRFIGYSRIITWNQIYTLDIKATNRIKNLENLIG